MLFLFRAFEPTFAEILKSEIPYKALTACIFLAAFLVQTFSRNFVIADYYTNTAKYAKNCVNKARPKMHCNGKCQMMKKLQQEEKKDQDNPEKKSENKFEIVLSTKSFFATIKRTDRPRITKILFPRRAEIYAYNPAYAIFHPPKA